MQKSIQKNFTLKDRLFAIVETTRPYTLLWCGLVSLSGACIAYGSFPKINIAILVTFVPIIGWIAGLCLSDYFDRQLDKIQKAHRPIPSGRIKSYEVLLIGAFFALSGLILSSLLGIYNVCISLLAASFVLLYARFSKSRGILGNINRGLITGTAFFFGVVSINNSLNLIPIYVWFISLIFIIHDINSNLIGAIRDVEGDKRGGYSTFPVKYGIRMSISMSLFLTIIWTSLAIAIPFYFNFLNTLYYFILALVFIIILLLYFFLFKSLYVLNRKKALRAHEFFVVERITLASAFIFGTSTVVNASIILIIAITITLLMQYLLRGRYEFGKEI
jgi:4-hydroxybenzoate polyprenyltransferase/geranylgeranylglycerol-phosphate geranylgeranyltransferase